MSAVETPTVIDAPSTDSEDAAWASITTPLTVEELIEFCNEDVERLLRINPFVEFKHWKERGNGSYQYNFKNSSQEKSFELELELRVEQRLDGLTIHYSSGLKQSTQFKVEGNPLGSKLIIIENYAALGENEHEARMNEVDKSLITWAKDLQLYLMRWKRWSRIVPWRWYMKYVWQPMKPTGRRITYMLLWISLVEVGFIALGAAIYFAEYR